MGSTSSNPPSLTSPDNSNSIPRASEHSGLANGIRGWVPDIPLEDSAVRMAGNSGLPTQPWNIWEA